MKVFERWRIVPQLCLLLAALAGGAHAAFPELPPVPSTVEQAQSFLAQRDALGERGTQAAAEQERACYQKTLISNCLRELEANQARFKRDLLRNEKAAKELLRLEDLKNRPVKPDAAASGTPSDDPAATGLSQTADQPAEPIRDVRSPKAAGSGKAAAGKASRSATEEPSISAGQQALNRKAFEQRQIEAQQRQAQSAQRLREQEAKRARYQQQLDERERRAAEQR